MTSEEPWLVDSDGVAWKWCDCGDPEHDGYVYCANGWEPSRDVVHRHLTRAALAGFGSVIGEPGAS